MQLIFVTSNIPFFLKERMIFISIFFFFFLSFFVNYNHCITAFLIKINICIYITRKQAPSIVPDQFTVYKLTYLNQNFHKKIHRTKFHNLIKINIILKLIKKNQLIEPLPLWISSRWGRRWRAGSFWVVRRRKR